MLTVSEIDQEGFSRVRTIRPFGIHRKYCELSDRVVV
jgi:hypothetical protein